MYPTLKLGGMARITVYDVPEDVLGTFKQVAEQQHRTMTKQLLWMIESAVDEYETAEKQRRRTGLRITEEFMASESTRHTAHVTPSGSWAVSWLPNRVLTQGQAVTAMTIAEVLATHDVLRDPVMSSHRLWPFIDNWAQELGMSGPQAVAEASRSPEDHREENQR
jgi:hypothetical protein